MSRLPVSSSKRVLLASSSSSENGQDVEPAQVCTKTLSIFCHFYSAAAPHATRYPAHSTQVWLYRTFFTLNISFSLCHEADYNVSHVKVLAAVVQTRF